MNQLDRDRLVVLKKVQKKLIRQAQAASEYLAQKHGIHVGRETLRQIVSLRA